VKATPAPLILEGPLQLAQLLQLSYEAYQVYVGGRLLDQAIRRHTQARSIDDLALGRIRITIERLEGSQG